MSVYRPDRTPYFQYDFRIKGRRFHGSTGQTARRSALAFEERIRREIAEGKHGEAAQLTLDQAAGKWWREHGSKLATARSVESRLENLIALFPPDIRLGEITTAHVSEAMQKRAAQTYQRAPAETDDPQFYSLAAATVNRDVLNTVRAILTRARKHWDAKGLNEIRWSDVRLQTPSPRTRWFSVTERTAWRAECGPATGLFLECLLTYGPRFGELFDNDPFHAFDPDEDLLSIEKRKRDVPLVIPVRQDHAAEFRARIGRARKAEIETVWFLEVVDAETGAITLDPIPKHGMAARLKSAARRAGVKPGRLIHSTRHHAGTAALRQTKSLRATQQLLGHADPRSTIIYAHTLVDELRDALEGIDVVKAGDSKTKDRRRAK